MDTSLPTYVLLLLIRLLLSSSSIDLRPCTEGEEEEGRPEWTLGRARVTTPCAALNGERGKIEKSFPHPIPRLVTLMGNMEGRSGGGTIVLLAGRDEMRGLARGRGALLSLGAMLAIHAEKALQPSTKKKGDNPEALFILLLSLP